jgi:hypothetical protein
VHRLHIMSILLIAVPIAVGLDPLAARVSKRMPVVSHVLALLVIGGLAVARLPQLERFSSPAMELEVRNTLESLPTAAVIFGSIDELDVGIRYLQLARDVRTDVLFVRADDLAEPWYHALFPNAGLRVDAPMGVPLKVYLAEQVLAQGRPLFVSQGEAVELTGYVKVPYGIVTQVLPRGAHRPSLGEVVTLNRRLFGRFRLDYAFPGPADEFATWIHRNYARVWTMLAQAMAANGQADTAAELEEIARQLSPR